LDYSPIKGPEGNIEYLLYLSKMGEQIDYNEITRNILNIVKQSHISL